MASGPITRSAELRSDWSALANDPGVAKTDGTRPGEKIDVTAQPADEIWTLTGSIQNPTTGSEIAQPAWHYRIANFPTAWDYSHGSAAVPVAIIDTEFDIDHPDLKDKFLPGINLSPLDSATGTYRTTDVRGTAQDPTFHGTHVAGLVGAATNNVVGVSGAGYDTPLVPIKINFNSPSIVQDIAEALNYAIGVHPAAINMSFGGTQFNPSWADALARARAAGIVPVASAANDQQQRPGFTFYPAAHNGVLAVGATTPSDQIAFFSSTGAFVDVSAPGDPILSTWDRRLTSNIGATGYFVDGGTSMAAPIVSGLVALVKSRRPDLTADEIEAIIEGSAEDKGLPGKDQNYGTGRIDAGRALQQAVIYTRPSPQPPAPVVADSRARTKVKLTTLSLSVRKGKLFTIKGRITPTIAGVTVRIQIRRSGASTYHTIKSTRSKAGGKVSVSVRIGKKGRYALRSAW